MVAFTKTALSAITLFTSLVSADCGFNILNINGAAMGTGCARAGGSGTLDLPDYGPAKYTVSATGSCGLSIVSRVSPQPASVFNGWTVGYAGPCSILNRAGGGGGGGGGGGAAGGIVGPVAPPVSGAIPLFPPGGVSGGRAGRNNPRKCQRERCSGPQGCCTEPLNGACPFRKECNNYPCDSCCGIPVRNWTSCSRKPGVPSSEEAGAGSE